MPVYTEATVAATGASAWIPLNQYSQPFNVGFGVTVVAPAASAAVTTDFSVQHTFVDVLAGASAGAGEIFDHSDVSGRSGSTDGNYAFPVAAVRVNVSALASGGAVVLRVRQAGL